MNDITNHREPGEHDARCSYYFSFEADAESMCDCARRHDLDVPRYAGAPWTQAPRLYVPPEAMAELPCARGAACGHTLREVGFPALRCTRAPHRLSDHVAHVRLDGTVLAVARWATVAA